MRGLTKAAALLLAPALATAFTEDLHVSDDDFVPLALVNVDIPLGRHNVQDLALKFDVQESDEICGDTHFKLNGQQLSFDEDGSGNGEVPNDDKAITAHWDLSCVTSDDGPEAQLLRFSIDEVEGHPVEVSELSLVFRKTAPALLLDFHGGLHKPGHKGKDKDHHRKPHEMPDADDELEAQIHELELLHEQVDELMDLIHKKEMAIYERFGDRFGGEHPPPPPPPPGFSLRDCDSVQCVVYAITEKVKNTAGNFYGGFFKHGHEHGPERGPWGRPEDFRGPPHREHDFPKHKFPGNHSRPFPPHHRPAFCPPCQGPPHGEFPPPPHHGDHPPPPPEDGDYPPPPFDGEHPPPPEDGDVPPPPFDGENPPPFDDERPFPEDGDHPPFDGEFPPPPFDGEHPPPFDGEHPPPPPGDYPPPPHHGDHPPPPPGHGDYPPPHGDHRRPPPPHEEGEHRPHHGEHGEHREHGEHNDHPHEEGEHRPHHGDHGEHGHDMFPPHESQDDHRRPHHEGHPPPPHGHGHHGPGHHHGPPPHPVVMTFGMAAIALALFSVIGLGYIHRRISRLSPESRRSIRRAIRRSENERRSRRSPKCKGILQRILSRWNGDCDEEKESMLRHRSDSEDSVTMEQEIARFREAAFMVEGLVAVEEGRNIHGMHPRFFHHPPPPPPHPHHLHHPHGAHPPPPPPPPPPRPPMIPHNAPETPFSDFTAANERLPSYDDETHDSSVVSDGCRYTPHSSDYAPSDTASNANDVLGDSKN